MQTLTPSWCSVVMFIQHKKHKAYGVWRQADVKSRKAVRYRQTSPKDKTQEERTFIIKQEVLK